MLKLTYVYGFISNNKIFKFVLIYVDKKSKSNDNDEDEASENEAKSEGGEESTEEDVDENSKKDKKENDKPVKVDKAKSDKKEKENDKKEEKETKNDKEVEKNENDDKEEEEEEEDDGAISLGEIDKININLNKTRVEQLQTLYIICFDTPGKTNVVKKNLRNFNGFGFDLDSDAFKKRVEATQKNDLKSLKAICDTLVLDKKGSKEDISGRICKFLVAPDPEALHEPSDNEAEEEEAEEEEIEEPSPKKQKSRGGREDRVSKSSSGRPKRATAGRGFNRDYSSSEESDDRFQKPKQRRRNASESESDVSSKINYLFLKKIIMKII